MNLRLYRYGEATELSGVSVGVARQLPPKIPRADYAVRGYFDVAMPSLAPSRELQARFRKEELRFGEFARAYRKEMTEPEPRRAIRLVAGMAQTQVVNLGCYCRDEARCHRSVLRTLIDREMRDQVSAAEAESSRAIYASPACSMPEVED